MAKVAGVARVAGVPAVAGVAGNRVTAHVAPPSCPFLPLQLPRLPLHRQSSQPRDSQPPRAQGSRRPPGARRRWKSCSSSLNGKHVTHSAGAAAAEPASDPQSRPWLWGLGEGGPATSHSWATGAHAVPHPQASEQQAGLGLRPKLPVALRASRGGHSPGDGLHACLRRAPRSLSAAFLEKSTAPLPRGEQNNAPSKMHRP